MGNNSGTIRGPNQGEGAEFFSIRLWVWMPHQGPGLWMQEGHHRAGLPEVSCAGEPCPLLILCVFPQRGVGVGAGAGRKGKKREAA